MVKATVEPGRGSMEQDHPEAPEALDDNYLDFTLPSLDDHADRLREHPAWPWVCWDGVSGGGAVEVDYWALSMG